jgi:hypothetical protein
MHGDTLELPQGITITCQIPERQFRIQYQSPRLALDVVFTAARLPNVSTCPIGASKLFAGRIDQCGHVAGQLTLAGERIAVDCHSMRDRSWGIRRDDNYTMNIGYFHATADADTAFLAVSNHAGAAGDEAPIVSGYLLQNGVYNPLASGSARLSRDDKAAPAACTITAVDSAGRELRAHGQSISLFAYQPFPGMFNWSSLAQWECNGRRCFGELQNTWHPDGWRSLRRGY